ncbi:MAG: hypothetical protein KH440_08375 [Oscillospiraceae bacterium]|nr:hypothetical protein [Oscillospiraceae bacterium]
MEGFVKAFLQKRGYDVNETAQTYIKACEDWYSNKEISSFHCRNTVQGTAYKLQRLNFAKRCCSDDANLCEVLEINAGPGEQNDAVNDILNAGEFQTQYRKQLEKTSADGTVACYIRLDNATLLDNGKATGGDIRLNYVEADCFIPLTVVNDIVTEAGFSGTSLRGGKKQTTLVLFVLNESGLYEAETHVFDEKGNELQEYATTAILGDVKPFAVMRNAEVNNLDGMEGYGLPKLWNAIPMLKALELCYNVLFGDLDKADKLLLVNEMLCKFDNDGNPITPCEQAKKVFVMLGQKLPGKDDQRLVQEYNPVIRVDDLTKTFELLLSLLSLMFGYGTKKYSFENGQITTATEYIGERQDQMQELNRQRQEARRYIQDICRAVMWFSNTFHGTAYNLESEILVDFDDSYITDKESELERRRNDALSFDIPQLTIWYLMEAYSLSEEEATALVEAQQEAEERDPTGEEED